MTNIPAQAYQEELSSLKISLRSLMQKRNRLAWARFIVFILTIILSWQAFIVFDLWGLAVVVAGIAGLLFLISTDTNNNHSITNTKTLISLCEEELRILNHQFNERFDGALYLTIEHDYANDLDLFGKASVFQWANRCESDQGRNLLAKTLLNALPTETIIEKQEAVKEIAPLMQWRQQLRSYSIRTKLSLATEAKTRTWLDEEKEYYGAGGWKVFVNIYSLFTLASLIAAMGGWISGSSFISLYLLYFIISMLISRNTIKPYIHLSGIVKEVDTLQQLVRWIEEKKFNSTYINKLKKAAEPRNEKAAAQIRELKNILDRFDLRLNIVGILFFNSFLLWDLRQMIALNNWRRKNKLFVKKWFELVAEMEVLNSLAAIHFNQPTWFFADFTTSYFNLEGIGLGHPLIPEAKRVDNDFSLNGTGKIALITGSNMAGKSTFLRSLGVNIVLSQMGAPACAKKLVISPVRLMSSMRIADNLAENTSTFYAELKKLKTIIETVNRNERVFILLDEILRGTNSMDRHTGSEALIAQLIRQKAVAVIATHDLELAALEKNYPESIENYHFDVQVKGEELEFDYELKNGVCSSMNASILMKKIGIELGS